MTSTLKYYGSSYLVTAVAMILGYLIGGIQGMFIVAILGVLEVSLSFDNAVVNAKVLQNWGPVWRRRFIVYGIPIAVFGMRLVFPLAIVAVVGSMSFIDAFQMAMNDPKEYERVLVSAHHEIAAFGAAFLMMVFLKFFLDPNKDHHWVEWLERPLAKAGHLEAFEIVVVVGSLIGVSTMMPTLTMQLEYLVAGLCGLVVFVAAESVGTMVGGEETPGSERIIKEGIAGFMYLELLDASFSFDGVIAAFALTNNIFIIMIGLAVGAMFVRSMTLHMVDKGTLSEFRYLEHSAFYAIGVLATIMLISAVVHVPEAVTGLLGAVLIVAGVWHSIIANKRDAAN